MMLLGAVSLYCIRLLLEVLDPSSDKERIDEQLQSGVIENLSERNPLIPSTSERKSYGTK